MTWPNTIWGVITTGSFQQECKMTNQLQPRAMAEQSAGLSAQRDTSWMYMTEWCHLALHGN